MSMLKRENNMVKSKALKQMIAYEQCMKSRAMLTSPPLALNRRPQRNVESQEKGMYNECLKNF